MHILGSVSTGPVETVPYRTDWNCLELLGTVPTVSHLHGIGSKKFQGLCQIVNVFQSKDFGMSFVFRNKDENSFNSIV